MSDELQKQAEAPAPEDERDIAKAVEERAAELLQDEERKPLDPQFVKECLEGNERGDGCMAASLFRDRFLLNVTYQKYPDWYAWRGNVWERDDFKESHKAVEECALEYARQSMALTQEIKEKRIEKDGDDGWKVTLRDNYLSRVKRLRSENGIKKALAMAAIVDSAAMACRESDFNQQPWLLPVTNGVIDLRTGALTSGVPSDRMTKALPIEYDPHAEYGPWIDFVKEVSGSEEMERFQRRSFGCGATGFSHEQYIWVYIGPGRNGKGLLFNLIADVLGPYYHEISRAMILEQKNEPSANAASEHKYSLLNKRIIVAAETNKGQKIDAAALKSLTGQNRIVCRPNFSSEIIFEPTHSTFLQTNNMPFGLTKEFSLIERLLIIDFPFMYVDDPEEKKRKFPVLADKFRKKDPKLYDKLSQYKPGILRWLVEGCLEWQQIGLAPPAQVLECVNKLANDEDYVQRFVDSCLDHWPGPDDHQLKTSCSQIYDVFKWWWQENSDQSDKHVPAMKTINKALRDKGHIVEPSGGKTWVWRITVKQDVVENMRKE
ncbi:MAG: hypothetical protein VR65_06105 [Desulfobulbaceae bacterium BRH_c16a]|nr:MAG: hypothetical protein VR65_06105 [Desulfobulbaceae bacterium BRH_c16a]